MTDQNIRTNASVEVLAPAGSLSILKEALTAGADAVYISGKRFGARAYAPNFTDDELREALDYAHLRGRRLHLTVNTLMKEEEMGEELYRYLQPLVAEGLDAVIVQDTGVLDLLHSWFPGLPLHASTQMSITSAEAAELLRDSGVSRVIPARELSLPEIRAIAAVPGLQVEAFVHGAMCYAYSGKCLFSSTLGERSGNRGTCAQPCRLAYRSEMSETEQYLLSMQDLCALDKVPDLIRSGVCSFKIEGRMKDAGYVTAVTSLYRRYVDRALSESCDTVRPDRRDMALAKSYARSISGPGYLAQRNGPEMITPLDPSYQARGEKIKIPDGQDTVRVSADLSLHIGSPARMRLRVHGREAEAVSDQAVAPAMKAPLTRQDVCARLSKRDKWPFVTQWDHIDMDDQAFLPVATLNAMRREAFRRLSESLLTDYKRITDPVPPIMPQTYERTERSAAVMADRGLHVLATTIEQFEVLLDEPSVSVIMAESDLLSSDYPFDEQIRRVHHCDHPKRVLLALPHIFRPQGEPAFVPAYLGDKAGSLQIFDGVLVRAIDELAWLRGKKSDLPVYTDYLIYAFNTHSMCYLSERGVSGICYSPEMSRHDIKAVESGLARTVQQPEREILVYGKQIRMLSAQCLVKNTEGCSHKPGLRQLTDRRGVKFNVQNRCDSCYNILYNSVPVSLHNQLDELRCLPGATWRLDLTDESAQAARKVIRLFTDPAACECDYEYTKGHFERSVL